MLSKEQLETIESETKKAILENIKKSIVVFWYGRHRQEENLGTGHIINGPGGYLLITCEHVMREVLGSQDCEITAYGSLHIDRKDLQAVVMDTQYDIAIAKLPQSFAPVGRPIDYTALNTTFDPGDYSEQDCFTILGFPAELAQAEKDGPHTDIINMAFTTVFKEDMPSTTENIYLDYPYGEEICKDLPKAPGLSGALIAHCPKPVVSLSGKTDLSDIWTPSSIKYIGIQSKWHLQKGYCLARPLKINWRDT